MSINSPLPKTMPASERRQQAERKGRWAEHAALLYLMAKGYRPLARNLRNHAGEIDLIMKQGRVFVMVEVKLRRHRDDAIEAVTWNARKRISRAAEVWLAHAVKSPQYGVRFDIMALSARRWPAHIRDAWRLDEL
jgi:putative endonuclease